MPYLIGVHSSLTEVSGGGQGLWGWVELSPLPPRCPRCQGSSGSERGTPYHPPSQRVLEKGLEDVVMMNVDSNILETPFDDVQALPPDVVSVTPPVLLLQLGGRGPKPTRSAPLPCSPGVPAEAAAKEGRTGPGRRGVPSFPQSPGPALWGVP